MKKLIATLAFALLIPALAFATPSRDHVSASTQSLAGSFSANQSPPITMGCWMTVDTGASSWVISLGDGLKNVLGIQVDDTANTVVPWTINFGVGTYSAGDSYTISPDTWYFVAAVWDGAGNVSTWLNNTTTNNSLTTNALGFAAPTNMAQLEVGGESVVVGSYADGKICHCAFWNVALTTRELETISAGRIPPSQRSDGLVGWWPYDGGLPELDRGGQGSAPDLTANLAAPSTDKAGPPVFQE